MNDQNAAGFEVPRITPSLDPAFRPAALANRAFRQLVRRAGGGIPVEFALEQADGSCYRFATEILPGGHPQAGRNFPHLERMMKFVLWSRGGWRIYFNGPDGIGEALRKHYLETPTGRFDSEIVGRRIYGHPIELVMTKDLPEGRAKSAVLGRHLDGCRIGFDLGGSDRKAAAVHEGRVVFSEEVPWDPVPQADPRYHYDGIMHSLREAAKHLPRVDAIGGSAAGVYVNNRVKVASLFRGVPPELFEQRVKEMFLEIQREWGNVPFEIVNDGEVTALAGSMALGENAVLGIAMGTSTAGGYVNQEGKITSWLNEFAFTPVDCAPAAPVDEWSGDRGCGAQYFSQQAVGRLARAAGIETGNALPLPELLKHVQALMLAGNNQAMMIYQTIGTYLGYAIAHYSDFYDFKHVLVLGRVTSGTGGDVILAGAKEVLASEFPELARRVAFHIPGETEKRHGQAVAAASLPKLRA